MNELKKLSVVLMDDLIELSYTRMHAVSIEDTPTPQDALLVHIHTYSL